jgi:hypothetical protein
MRIVKQARTLIGLALIGAAGMAWADVPPVAATTETVVVLGASLNCNEASPEHARQRADTAWQDGDYQRAGECYLAAGQHALADQAFVKASAQAREDTSRRLASNLSDVKAQARQMKQAFQRR